MVKGTKNEWGKCFRTVSLGEWIWSLSYWNNIIAVGSENRDIIILNAITGTHMSILSGHTDQVISVVFSSDRRLLVSGSGDKTVKLWDVQTGGVVKTFYGHTQQVWSVSISADCAWIASGSEDNTIHLWNIQSGKCHCSIEQENAVHHVNFFPTSPQHIISISSDKVWQWDINGHQIPPTYAGSHIAFSPDHTQFVLCSGNDVTVQNSDSRVIVAEFHVADKKTTCCCFSPDGRLVAAAAGNIAYVWKITSPDPYLVETFDCHTGGIKSLVFSSSSTLISASSDQSVKFWQIGDFSTGLVATDLQPTPLTLPPIVSISLQARAGVAISSDSNGLVKTWDISTGVCKASFQTPAGRTSKWGQRDAQLINGKVIFVWYRDGKICVWDTEKGKLLQTLDTPSPHGLRISGDGSKIICLGRRSIQAWSMWTWELVGKVELGLKGILYLDSLYIDSSRVWIHSTFSSAQEGWDFGISGSSPMPFNPSTGRPHLDYIGGAPWQTDDPCWIKDMVTGKKVFELSGRYTKPNDVQWNGQYLVAGYDSGEILILDFHSVLSRDI